MVTCAPGRSDDVAVLGAFRHLAGQGVVGLVWLNTDLVCVAREGTLVDFVPVGEPVADHLLALHGLEDELHALRTGEREAFELPAVQLYMADTATPKLNIEAFWRETEQRFLLLVNRAPPRSDVDELLAQQTRLRLMTEAELARQKRELELANRDLEQFAGIVSHDLQAPLRAMRYLAEEVALGLDNPGSGNSKAKLAALQAQTRRMSGMLRALLEYSSVGRKEEAIERIETSELIGAIVSSMARPQGMEVVIEGTWPAIETVSAPLDLVVRNLIDNAIKHHDLPVGRIIVSAEPRLRELVLTITDDGPGIDPVHRSAVLRPFGKLDGASFTEGYGMGLALVQRTLDAVGGRLELDSEPQTRRGTRFRVFWPLRIAPV